MCSSGVSMDPCSEFPREVWREMMAELVRAKDKLELAAMADSTDNAPSSSGVTYRVYKDESDLPVVMRLIDNELSEPYTIYTYRYFLQQWPKLCYLAYDGDTPFGTVVCKMDLHRDHMRGYVAMLVVDKAYRGKGAGSELVRMAIREMIAKGCEEVVLEAEVSNTGALKLYQALGFVRDKRLHRYYLNGEDAFRLKLLLPETEELKQRRETQQVQNLDVAVHA